MEYVIFGMAVASLLLHFIAPKTKTKADDKAAKVLDEAGKLLPVLKGGDKKPEGPVVRDHR